MIPTLTSAAALAPDATRTSPGTGGEPPVIRIRRLEKRFPAPRALRDWLRHPRSRSEVPVLRGVSLDVPRGGFFGLLGPNGAGKSTLFKILATLVRPDAGRVEIEGIDGLEDPAAVRRVLTPVIADERSLHWRLSATENLRLYAALYRVTAGEREGRIRSLLATVGLEEAAHRMVGTYSSGMKQRLLIARALLSRPSVLLLDEPTRSLDPISARDFRIFLREEVAGRQGCTVMLATHDAEEAFELCDRLALLDRGRVVALGTAAELSRAAANERCRLTVRRADALRAIRILDLAGLGRFAPQPDDAADWAVIEGPAPGAPDRTAELNAALSREGVQVAEIERVRLPLAELIERLVARHPAGTAGPEAP